jgi:hypothetical protein
MTGPGDRNGCGCPGSLHGLFYQAVPQPTRGRATCSPALEPDTSADSLRASGTGWKDGPVAITFEFEFDRLHSREFLLLMREVRLIHLRNGAFGWRLDEDLTRFNTYRIELMVPSWKGYLLQRQRLTKAEQEIIKKVWRLHVGEQVPLEHYYLCANRELEAQHMTETHASSTPTTRWI